MTARLPSVGGDSGNWGSLLNTYLQAEHNADGTHAMSPSLVTEIVNTVGASGPTLTIPAPSTSGISNITLTSSCTLTFPTAVAGQSFTLLLRQGGTGSYTIVWPSSIVKWGSGIAPTLTTTVGAVDILGFFCVDGTNWFGYVSGQDMK